ncbi:hypothetical protein HanXRQr2_Chr11g0480961 [Helianthus annuus]|uniref:Uncharacterized protein n=1 Tax=Helianthus annuus TaxID=4232 RepID=A0A9K3MZQ9_HELAN|nr:hypothetical protein HanXRQr2_Chr11g0480961 [Helianthus annuus]
MANRAGDKKYKRDSDVEPIRLHRLLLHDLHSQLVTDSTTRTTVRPRGSNHCAPMSLSSASTHSRVRGDKHDIPCWRRPAQGPSAHLLLHTLRL